MQLLPYSLYWSGNNQIFFVRACVFVCVCVCVGSSLVKVDSGCKDAKCRMTDD